MRWRAPPKSIKRTNFPAAASADDLRVYISIYSRLQDAFPFGIFTDFPSLLMSDEAAFPHTHWPHHRKNSITVLVPYNASTPIL